MTNTITIEPIHAAIIAVRTVGQEIGFKAIDVAERISTDNFTALCALSVAFRNAADRMDEIAIGVASEPTNEQA